MRTLMGLITVGGNIVWQSFGPELSRDDPEDGISIRFRGERELLRRKGKAPLQEILELNRVNWLWQKGESWFLDLDRLRAEIPDLGVEGWATGVTLIEPRLVGTIDFGVIVRFNLYKEDYAVDRLQKVFLSHKSADKGMVREYFRVLKALGFEPWLDEEAMPAGTNLERGLSQGFKDSCAAIFFITPNYLDTNYLATEVDYAIREKRAKGDRFQIVTIVFKDGKDKAVVPELLQGYVWKEPSSPLTALEEILRALPIAVGPPEWRPNLARPEPTAPPAAPPAVTFRVNDAAFAFMGQDSAGGSIPSTKAEAKWGSYRFKLSAFNPRPKNVGLMDIFVHYAKAGVELHKHPPGEDTGEKRGGARHFRPLTALTLPSQEWLEMAFGGGHPPRPTAGRRLRRGLPDSEVG